MSKQAIKWAKDLRIPKRRGQSVAAMKAVLLCIAWHADDEGRNAFPAVTTIEGWSGLSRKPIMRAIQHLEELELVTVTRTKGKVNHYVVPLGYWCPSDTSSGDTDPPDPEQLVSLRPSTGVAPTPDPCPSDTRIGTTYKSSRESPVEGSSIGAQRLEVDEWLADLERAESCSKPST